MKKRVRLFRQKLRGIAPVLLVAILICAYGIHIAQAAVTLVRFEVKSSTTTVITLEWETATEYNHLGYFVLRSLTESGTYVRDPNFIAAEGSAVSGSIYDYSDHNVSAGQTYFYKLEAIDNNSASEFFGPLIVTAGQAAVTATPSATATQLATGSATITNTGTLNASATITRTATITLTASNTPTATETSQFRFSTNTSTSTASITPPVTETPLPSLTNSPEASLTATELVVKTSTLEVTATPDIEITPAPESKQSSPILLMLYGFLGVVLVGGAALAGWIWYQRRSGVAD